MRPIPAFAIAALVLATGCGAPDDPRQSTTRIRDTHVLRAGISNNPPWISWHDGKAQGPEADLVNTIAARLGARVQWVPANETQLMDALKRYRLDVVAGGFTTSSPWSSEAGPSLGWRRQPWFAAKHVLLVAPGENRLLLAVDQAAMDARDRP